MWTQRASQMNDVDARQLGSDLRSREGRKQSRCAGKKAQQDAIKGNGAESVGIRQDCRSVQSVWRKGSRRVGGEGEVRKGGVSECCRGAWQAMILRRRLLAPWPSRAIVGHSGP